MNKGQYLFLTLLFTGCGRDYTDPAIESGSVGSTFEVSSVISDANLVRGRNICNAIRSKRIKIQTDVSASSILYTVASKDCSDISTDLTVTALIGRDSSGDPSFTATVDLDDEFVDDVLTDEEGVLSTFCTEVFAGSTPSIVTYPSSLVVQYIEFIADDTFRYRVGIRGSTDSTEYTTTAVNTFQVNISNSSALNYGYVQEYEESQTCPGDSSIESSYGHSITTIK